jgi:hypothetical protein
MRWKLSHIEHLVDVNIVFAVRLESSFTLNQLRSALSRVQRKHPALRASIREESDGLYYEADSAPEIPMRIVQRLTEDDYWRECQTELTTAFAYDTAQLRVVWLRSEVDNDVIITTPHRICDCMSILTIAREVLRSLHNDEELVPYEPIMTRDLIGDYRPAHAWKRKLAVHVINRLLGLIPSSCRAVANNEHHAEWRADRALSDALKQRCKLEGVSIHAVLVVALERALLAVFGEKKVPKSIINPIDLRRGRFAALKSDMLFYGGGNFKIATARSLKLEFWARARTINEEIRRKVEQEVLEIPRRFDFLEQLRPISKGQIRALVRLGDALNFNGAWNRIGLSNLGNIAINDGDQQFRLKDVHLYMHSFNFRMLGLVPYTVNGKMRFYCVGDEKCISRSQLSALEREFMALLRNQVAETERPMTPISSAERSSAALTEACR